MYTNTRLFIFCTGSPKYGGTIHLPSSKAEKREWMEILFYRGRRKHENETKRTKSRIILSHRVF
jgi:hypothetical protein